MVMVCNEDKTTTKMLKTLLTKSDVLDHRLTNMDNNIKAEIIEIKISLENFDALQKEEVTKIKKTVKNFEESHNLINKIFDDQKEKLAQLTKNYKYLFAENTELRNENNVLLEKYLKNSKKKKKSLLNTCVSNGCWKFQGFHSEKMMTANI